MKRTLSTLLLFCSLSLLQAQQHPLPVERVPLLDAGTASFDFGIAHFRHQRFPLSGLTGDLSKFGDIKLAVALSEYAQVEMSGTLLNVLQITRREPAFNSAIVISSNPTADIGDFTFWTKVAVLSEYSSGLGAAIRFGVQLPNASNESGLGVDELNFYSTFLFQKHFAGLWTLNVGLGILGDPTTVSQQHDVFLYGIEYLLPVGSSTFFMAQVLGRRGHEGIGVHHLSSYKAGLECDLEKIDLSLLAVANDAKYDRSAGVEFTIRYQMPVLDVERKP